MGRPTTLDRLHRNITDMTGSRVKTTARGVPAYVRPGEPAVQHANDVLADAFRPQRSINFEVPSRNEFQSYLMQEIYATCSIFSRGVNQLAGDTTQDSQADQQPYTVSVFGESDSRKTKIFEELDGTFRRVGIGLSGKQRVRRALKTGMGIAEPIFSHNGRWYLTGLRYLPTYEMFKDADGIWRQIRKSTMGNNRVIAEWPVPDLLPVTTYEEDDNHLYGTPIGMFILVDYRLFLMALEDTAVSSRTRAPRRLMHILGEDARTPVSDKTIRIYRKKISSTPLNIVHDYFLRNGLEQIKEIEGDAAGTKAIAETCREHQNRMRRAMGLPAEPENMAGRGLEEIDAEYARTINDMRMMDAKFIKKVGDLALAVAGYKDVDWSAQIPPIGESQNMRVTRASKELELGHIGLETYAAWTGEKSAARLKEDIADYAKFRRSIGLSAPGEKAKKVQRDRQDVAGSESADKGADPQKGRTRRNDQRRAGMVPTGA